ncbi:putative Late nodulin [Medicago truncatula]|uniref:Putative Late nodulin n=1 Tax=Medicago truncatula TaxID=3880 RepID=A0A396IQS9_MEDTR|nr:putative Late nodulin [Medicago truncatula]
MIIFLFIFLVAPNVQAQRNRFREDSDCPIEMCGFPLKTNCLRPHFILGKRGICVCV